VLLGAFALRAGERPGLRLLVAGPGDLDDVRSRVPGVLRDRLILLGQVSQEDKARFYHSVDVFCAPNTGGESFGVVLIEAMAAGAPIVASDLDAFRLVLRGGRAGELFPSGDPAALAAAAGRLLDDPVRRQRLSAAATDAVRAYDWPMVARDVVKVYEAVVRHRHHRGRHPGRRLRVVACGPAGPAARPGGGGAGRARRGAGPAQFHLTRTGRQRPARPGDEPAHRRGRARRTSGGPAQ
jgi:hypothetical protein